MPACSAARARIRRRTPPRASPSCSKLRERLAARTARRAAGARTRRARSTYSPTCDVGDVLQADLLAHAAEVDLRPSACRPAPQISSTLPGTARHMASPPLASAVLRSAGGEPTDDLAEREAAVVGRHAAGGRSTVKPSLAQRPRAAGGSSALRKTPPDERDRVEPVAVAGTRGAASTTRPATARVEAGGDDRGGRRRRARRRRPRATTGAGSATDGRRRRRRDANA